MSQNSFHRVSEGLRGSQKVSKVSEIPNKSYYNVGKQKIPNSCICEEHYCHSISSQRGRNLGPRKLQKRALDISARFANARRSVRAASCYKQKNEQ